MNVIAPDWNWLNVAAGLCVFLLTFFGTIAVAVLVLVRLPSDYLDAVVERAFMPNWPWPVRWAGLIAKNAIGVLTVAIGAVLTLPGMPGQGLLTIVLGLMLLDIPRKRTIVIRIVRIPRVNSAINQLRARYGKLPLIIN
jgi:hypothetical protein